MKPIEYLVGDCVEVMEGLPAGSVQCVCTSPPYYGLRSYLDAGHADKSLEIGSEDSPEAYVEKMVSVFRAVWRVLRDDGTLWLNLGSAHWGGKGASNYAFQGRRESESIEGDQHNVFAEIGSMRPQDATHTVFKPKDLIPIPWMVAMALQKEGWYLRSDIIWSKPNPMPESVTDRPTKAHEYMFLLTKRARYFYDADAVREEFAPDSLPRVERGRSNAHKYADGGPGNQTLAHDISGACGNPAGRNLRTVWTVPTCGYPGAHFATFPPKLIEPCIKAGTSERGCCPKCLAPWERIVERSPMERSPMEVRPSERVQSRDPDEARTACSGTMTKPPTSRTTGWKPGCDCGHQPVPCTVLDPFGGSGTTALVARECGCHAILIDLSEEYMALARKRNEQRRLF